MLININVFYNVSAIGIHKNVDKFIKNYVKYNFITHRQYHTSQYRMTLKTLAIVLSRT